MKTRCALAFFTFTAVLLIQASAQESSIAKLPPLGVETSPLAVDWLINPAPFKAGVYRSAQGNEIVLSNGLLQRVFRIAPNAATVALHNLMTGEEELRSVRPEASLTINGKEYAVGGLAGQPIHNYLLPEWLDKMTAIPNSFQFVGFEIGKTQAPFPWKKHREWMSQDLPWPAPGVSLTLHFAPPANVPALASVRVDVHYELFDGIPLIAKWITLKNNGAEAVHLDKFKSEILAVSETAPKVAAGEPREIKILNMPPQDVPKLYPEAPRDYIDRFTQWFVVSDYAFGGDMEPMKDNAGVRWTFDPLYKTGIGYYGQWKPCLLECTPPIGPSLDIAPRTTWESFRAYELLRDSTDQERRGLAECKLWRTVAPWTQENPLYMHVSSGAPDAVKLAIDQCAAVGFQMVIQTFGSGFNPESESPKYLAQEKQLADYARAKGIALGGYSLLASRGANDQNAAISPTTGKPANRDTGARFGRTPCLCSEWGEQYFKNLTHFYDTTGMGVFENDGSYPGDLCASTTHPGHKGLEDSQWQQWKALADFYRWCRGQGIYLTVPDTWFLNGSSKEPMGYVENNWSLPRDEQTIIERQNIYDGTWEKTPSMGFMFVPLTQYHGGGAAATIEPLREHLETYAQRFSDLFGAGVMACYRGPRLYDAPETEALVKKWVDFYKAHRAILDSDLIHLRRPDGRDWDGILHVNPSLTTKGFLMLYNPLTTEIRTTIRVPLYYTGLTETARVSHESEVPKSYTLDRKYNIDLPVTIPANGSTWYEIR